MFSEFREYTGKFSDFHGAVANGLVYLREIDGIVLYATPADEEDDSSSGILIKFWHPIYASVMGGADTSKKVMEFAEAGKTREIRTMVLSLLFNEMAERPEFGHNVLESLLTVAEQRGVGFVRKEMRKLLGL